MFRYNGFTIYLFSNRVEAVDRQFTFTFKTLEQALRALSQ